MHLSFISFSKELGKDRFFYNIDRVEGKSIFRKDLYGV